MDERLNAILAGALLAAAAMPSQAQQGLADPTRPPSFVPAQASDAAAPGPRLQSVLLSPGRKVAVIDGVTVALGARHGDATLVRITETEALLRGREGVTRLRLYPDIEKKTARTAGAHRAASGAATGEKKR